MPLSVSQIQLRFLTILLLLVFLVAGASFPSAVSQTFTNVLTTTGLFTTNAYSTNTIGTTTQTVVTMNTFVSTTDTLSSSGSVRSCFFDWWNITIDPGTSEVTGTIGPPSGKIDFYIMNHQQYHAFAHSECGNSPYAAEVAVYDLTSTYSLDWKNPQPGWYYFVFNNNISGNTPTITTPFILVATFNQTETSAVYNVVTNPVTISNTQTLTSVQVTQVSPGNGLSLDPTLVAVIIIAVVALLGGLYFVKSRAKKQGAVEGKTFCINCGAPLPSGSKFCNKCGTTQQ